MWSIDKQFSLYGGTIYYQNRWSANNYWFYRFLFYCYVRNKLKISLSWKLRYICDFTEEFKELGKFLELDWDFKLSKKIKWAANFTLEGSQTNSYIKKSSKKLQKQKLLSSELRMLLSSCMTIGYESKTEKIIQKHSFRTNHNTWICCTVSSIFSHNRILPFKPNSRRFESAFATECYLWNMEKSKNNFFLFEVLFGEMDRARREMRFFGNRFW